VKIYVVMGSTGEYSDHHNWLVCAYRTKEDAEQHEIEATKRAHGFKREDRYEPDFKDRLKAAMGEYDPECQMDYTGTDYCTIEVELRAKLPKAGP
jgi:hypothetical protein